MKILVCLFLGLLVVASAQNKEDLSVLFESHCPDSRNFIHNDLVPIFHKLESKIDLRLVPFGKAQSTKGGGFSCQHGPKECRGNMIMSCAFNRLSPGRAQLNYASCFMADPDHGGQRCCESSNISWAEVEQCLTSGEGHQLQLDAEKASTAIGKSNFVPTVTVRNNYSREFHNGVMNGEFKSMVCARYDISNCDE